jgi:hypothetical protein
MKNRVISILALTAICALTLITACVGGGAPDKTTAPPITDTPYKTDNADSADNEIETEPDYSTAIFEFAENFQEIMEDLDDLIFLHSKIETKDDYIEWAVFFMNIQEAVNEAARELEYYIDCVPEELSKKHALITSAVTAVYNTMVGFEGAVDILFFEGSDRAFKPGFAGFANNITVAQGLWNEVMDIAA